MSGINITIPIGNGFYQSESLPFSNQRCVNLYPNVPQVQSLSEIALFGTEGLTLAATSGRQRTDANRGSILFRNQPYFVNGSFLHRLDRIVGAVGDVSYRLVSLGRINGRGRVSMAENGNQIIIINNLGEGFIYQPDSIPTLQQISPPAFTANGKPEQVTYVDRYFVVTTDQKRAIISAVGDGLLWNALDSISAEADPDDVVAPFVHKNQLYLLGRVTTEQFQNIGGAGVPFRRVNGYVVDVGCDAPFSVINVGSDVYWLGRAANQRPSIWRFAGDNPEKVSTIAIDNKLQELTEQQLNSVFSFAYSQSGNVFVHFSTAVGTFVYNPTNGRWHERQSLTGRPNNLCRISSVVGAYNEIFAGDTEDGRVGIVDDSVYTEYEIPYPCFFTTQPIINNGNSFSLPKVELFCETGVGDAQTPEPQVRLMISRDGVQFEDAQTRSLGKSGERAIRPVWYKQGRISKLVAFKFSVSDPVPRRFYSLHLKVKASVYG